MLKSIKTIFLISLASMLMVSVLVACSSIQVSQDYEQAYNFAALKTFAWKPGADYGVKDNELVDERIRAAIVEQLTAKSYTLVDSETPDFFVSYNMSIKQKITSSGVSGGVSLGRSSYGRHGSIGMSTGSQVRAYDQGTLTIDFTNPLEDKLIWRGISTQAVDEHYSPSKSRVIINETVKKMLDQFPPQ